MRCHFLALVRLYRGRGDFDHILVAHKATLEATIIRAIRALRAISFILRGDRRPFLVHKGKVGVALIKVMRLVVKYERSLRPVILRSPV